MIRGLALQCGIAGVRGVNPWRRSVPADSLIVCSKSLVLSGWTGKESIMTTQMWICLAIFLFMILGFVFADKLHTSLGIVALCAILMTAYSGLMKPSDVLAGFANKNVLLITGMFIVAAGFNRTQAVKKISAMVYKISSGNFTVMLAGYLSLAFILTNMIPSPMVVFGIISPLLSDSTQEFKVSPSKVMFPLALVSVACCGVLPIGAGATTYATQNAYLESYGYTDFSMQLLDPFKARILTCLVVFLYALLIAPKTCPDQPSVPITLKAAGSSKDGKGPAPLSPVREVLGYGIFAVTTIALILQSHLGIDNWLIAMTGACFVLLTGVLTPQEAIKNLPIRIILMLVAALSVGGAMVSCGLGDAIGGAIAGALGSSHNNYLIGAAFFIIPFLLTQVMQNQSVSNIFRPIAIMTCKALGANPIGPIMLTSAACLTAFLTPMATGAIPPMMDAGGYNQRDLLKIGILPSIIISFVAVFSVMTLYPAFG